MNEINLLIHAGICHPGRIQDFVKGVQICERQRRDKLGGSSIGDAISQAFRVNLRQKRGFDRTHQTAAPRSTTGCMYLE